MNKIPLLATLLISTRYKLALPKEWRNKKKPISYYIQKMIQMFYSQSGISPTIKPGIPYLPCISLSQVEYAHLMFHHILPRICKSVKHSFAGFKSNKQIQEIFHQLWHVLTNQPGRPKDFPTTNLRDSSKGKKVKLKSLTTYRAAFELAVHGSVFGFDNYLISLLQQTLQWNGRFLSQNLHEAVIDELTDSCHKICIQLSESNKMTDFTADTPCLRTWLNLVDICLYWCPNAKFFFGLKYEGGNKWTKIFLVKSGHLSQDVLIIQHVTHQRLMKDILAIASGFHKPNCLGDGIREIVKQIHKGAPRVQKLLMYQNDDINGNMKFDHQKNNYNNDFIFITSPHMITVSAWLNLINYDNGIKLCLSAAGLKAQRIRSYLNDIIETLFPDSVCSIAIRHRIKQIIIKACKHNLIQISTLHGIGTFYRAWTDSIIKIDDSVWVKNRQGNFNLLQIVNFVKIDNLKTLLQSIDCDLNLNFEHDENSLIVVMTKQWRMIHNEQFQFDYRKYNFHETPLIQLSDECVVVNATSIIQNVYISHHHILPSQNDQIGLRRTIPNYPKCDKCSFPKTNSNHLNDQQISHAKSMRFCGVAWRCSQHSSINCDTCLNDRLVAGGKYDFDCKVHKSPIFKAYTIYQGYVNRLCISNTINETGW